jgi:hypothetical protein
MNQGHLPGSYYRGRVLMGLSVADATNPFPKVESCDGAFKNVPDPIPYLLRCDLYSGTALPKLSKGLRSKYFSVEISFGEFSSKSTVRMREKSQCVWMEEITPVTASFPADITQVATDLALQSSILHPLVGSLNGPQLIPLVRCQTCSSTFARATCVLLFYAFRPRSLSGPALPHVGSVCCFRPARLVRLHISAHALSLAPAPASAKLSPRNQLLLYRPLLMQFRRLIYLPFASRTICLTGPPRLAGSASSPTPLWTLSPPTKLPEISCFLYIWVQRKTRAYVCPGSPARYYSDSRSRKKRMLHRRPRPSRREARLLPRRRCGVGHGPLCCVFIAWADVMFFVRR